MCGGYYEEEIVMKTYPCQTEIEKYHLKGTFEGMTTTEEMGFMTWQDACVWAASVTESTRVPYVVTRLVDLNTKEVEHF